MYKLTQKKYLFIVSYCICACQLVSGDKSGKLLQIQIQSTNNLYQST